MCQQLGHGLGGPLGAVLEGAGAADPEQVVDVVGDGVLAVHAEHAHVEVDLGDPVVAARGVHAPRVALALEVLEQAVELARELGGDHHLVAAHVDEVVDVLDVDRALVDAGAARGARPERVLVDDRQLQAGRAVPVEGVAVLGGVVAALAGPDERALHLLAHLGAHGGEGRLVHLAEARVLAVGGLQVRRLREHGVAQVHDHELGAQRLAGVPGRALRLAAAALRACHEVDVVLPGELRDVALAEGRVVRRILEVDGLALVVDRQQRPEGVRPARGVDVHRRGEDVQVLGVQHDEQERQDHGDVEPDEDRLDPQVRVLERREPPSDDLRREGTVHVGGMLHGVRDVVDLGPAVGQQGRDDEEDHQEHEPGALGVGAEEA